MEKYSSPVNFNYNSITREFVSYLLLPVIPYLAPSCPMNKGRKKIFCTYSAWKSALCHETSHVNSLLMLLKPTRTVPSWQRCFAQSTVVPKYRLTELLARLHTLYYLLSVCCVTCTVVVNWRKATFYSNQTPFILREKKMEYLSVIFTNKSTHTKASCFCNTRFPSALCTIIAAALPHHNPQRFLLKSLNCFSDLYFEWPSHMATVSWNECPYLHVQLSWGRRYLHGWNMDRERAEAGFPHICAHNCLFTDCSITWDDVENWF